MLDNLHIPWLTSDILLEWNMLDDMYDVAFCFASKHLDDDGGFILLMPFLKIALLKNLEGNNLLKVHGFEITIDWLCHQPHLFAHPNYKSKFGHCKLLA
jgi:hypothetical protein